LKQATIEQPLLGNGSANRHERNSSKARKGYNNNGKLCFLRGSYRDVISKASYELQSISEELVGELAVVRELLRCSRCELVL
jgi:hypothetical protein